jgi:hypothetical protein
VPFVAICSLPGNNCNEVPLQSSSHGQYMRKYILNRYEHERLS